MQVREAAPRPSKPEFPVVTVSPEDTAVLVDHKIAQEEATAEAKTLMVEIEERQKRMNELRDVIQHAETGIRIKARAIGAEHALPDTAAIHIDTKARSVAFLDGGPSPRASLRS